MNSGQFEKGFTPWNKGLKGVNGTSENRFKKGNVPLHKKDIGDTRISHDGYTYVKVAEFGTKHQQWQLKHRVVYAQHHGEIPHQTIIRFYDNDMSNMAIDNLFAVTRAENVILNRLKFANEPVELKPTILAMVRMCLKAKIPYRISAQ